MSGKSLLAGLLASCGLNAAATATAASVASGKPGLSAEDQTAGTQSLETLVEAAHAEGRNAGMAEGCKAERERFGAVLTDDATTGRLGLAISLLSTTDLDADTIISNIKASPTAAETVQTAGAPAPAPARQQAARDPLAQGGDDISRDTPLVDTGRSAPPQEGPDEKAVAELWAGALADVNGGGITKQGSMWGDALAKAAPGRAN